MSAQIVVPELGESVVEARVARWLKKPGDAVSAGEPLVELETEKIDLEVGAEQTGVLLEIKRQEGEDVKVGELLGIVGTASGAPRSVAPPAPAKPQPASQPEPPAAASSQTAAASDEGATSSEQRGTSNELAVASQGDRATPTARKMAEQHAVDLARVPGTGGGGRVTKRDIESFMSGTAADAAPAATAPIGRVVEAPPVNEPTVTRLPTPSRPSGDRSEERIRMSKRRLAIARNLLEAQQTAAMLTTFNDVDMTAVMALRDRRKEAFKQRYSVSLGIASFFVKASISALKAFPRLNAEIQRDEMVLKHYYDIGIAVGAAQGLVVPVLRDADRMTFAEIELAIRDFAKRANDGTLTLEDLRGGTFTITNGGVFGSLLSTPILNPPQVGILGLHKIQDRPVAVNGQVVVRPMMYTALTYDHRIVDGLEAVQFLVRVKEFIEDPGHLLVES